MKTQNIRTKLFVLLIALVAVTAMWSAWGERHVMAIQDSEINSFSWGCAPGQTARLTVINSAEERGLIINWKFLDSEGRTLAEGPEPHIIPAGKMKSFDVSADELDAVRDRFGRIQMRAVVTGFGNQNDRNLHASVEVIDNATGKTTFTTVFSSNNL